MPDLGQTASDDKVLCTRASAPCLLRTVRTRQHTLTSAALRTATRRANAPLGPSGKQQSRLHRADAALRHAGARSNARGSCGGARHSKLPTPVPAAVAHLRADSRAALEGRTHPALNGAMCCPQRCLAWQLHNNCRLPETAHMRQTRRRLHRRCAALLMVHFATLAYRCI